MEKNKNEISIEKKVLTKQRKKLAILGTAPSCKDAPFKDQEFDIWGVAHCCFIQEIIRMDVIFEIHLKSIWIKDNTPFQRFPNATIYFQEKEKDFFNSKKYPLEDIRKKYKVNEGTADEADYLTSSIPYMIAMGIEAGYEEIHLYGIHLLQDEEYFFQRPCTEYFLGIAKGKGIKIYIPPAADILSFPYLYGWEEGDQETKKIKERLAEFDKRGQALMARKQQMTAQVDAEINQIIGAREDCKYFLRNMGKELR